MSNKRHSKASNAPRALWDTLKNTSTNVELIQVVGFDGRGSSVVHEARATILAIEDASNGSVEEVCDRVNL